MLKEITSRDLRSWSMLGERGTFFAIAMPEIGEYKDNLKLLTADVSYLSSMTRFEQSFPDKFLNVGIAEQNMIGIAAGLAMSGKCVFASTYASFIAVRSLEHIRQHLAHLQCNVKIIGTAAGVVTAKSGISHWATEDIAFMRALPNITILSPADAYETYRMAHWAASNDKPVYIRISGSLNCPIIHKEACNIEIGKAIKLMEGKNIAILATGMMVNNALKAAKIMQEQGLTPSVYDFHTIKPIDKDTLDEIFAKNKLIVTVEEHNIIGGLGSAIAEYKATKSNTPRQVFIGIPDAYSKCGGQRFVWEQLGLTEEKIAEKIIQEVKKRKIEYD